MLGFNLKNTIKHHKRLLICMIILSVCSVLVCDIGVFSFNTGRQNSLKYDRATEYTVLYNENFDAKLLSDKISTITEKYGKSIDMIYITVEAENDIYAFYKGSDVFSAGNLPQTDSQILIGAKTKAKGYEVDSVVSNSLGDFTVCGIRPMREYDEILPSAVSQGTQVNSVRFRWNYVLSARKSAQFQKQLGEIFSQKRIIAPESSDITQGLLLSLRSSIVISGIAVCNIMLVFSFLIKMKREIYSVMYLCGSSKKRIYISAALELLVYIVLGGTVGHIVFYAFLLDFQSSYENFILQGFIISYVVCIILCAVAVMPILAKSINDITSQGEEYV